MAALADGSQADGPLPTHPSSVVSGHAEGIVESWKSATEDPCLTPAAGPGSSSGVRAPGTGVAIADLGGLAASGAAGGVANVMLVRRNMGNAAQRTQVRSAGSAAQKGRPFPHAATPSSRL